MGTVISRRPDFQSGNVYVAEVNSVKKVWEFRRANKFSALIWNSRADRKRFTLFGAVSDFRCQRAR
jgi:hypothetical protein